MSPANRMRASLTSGPGPTASSPSRRPLYFTGPWSQEHDFPGGEPRHDSVVPEGQRRDARPGQRSRRRRGQLGCSPAAAGCLSAKIFLLYYSMLDLWPGGMAVSLRRGSQPCHDAHHWRHRHAGGVRPAGPGEIDCAAPGACPHDGMGGGAESAFGGAIVFRASGAACSRECPCRRRRTSGSRT